MSASSRRVAASNGQPGSIGLFASGNAANELAGEFLGDVFIMGDLVATGLKSAVVPLADGTHRRLYCVKSPESWFEDVGFGTLVKGRAEIVLDPGFASTVQTDQYHVFITEYDARGHAFRRLSCRLRLRPERDPSSDHYF